MSIVRNDSARRSRLFALAGAFVTITAAATLSLPVVSSAQNGDTPTPTTTTAPPTTTTQNVLSAGTVAYGERVSDKDIDLNAGSHLPTEAETDCLKEGIVEFDGNWWETNWESCGLPDLPIYRAGAPSGLWGHAGTSKIWLSDGDWFRLTTYSTADDTFGDWLATDVQLDDGTRGVWGDGTTIWHVKTRAVEVGGLFVYERTQVLEAFTLSSLTRDDAKSVDLADEAEYINGIWSDGTTVWGVEDHPAETGDAGILAFSLSDGSYDSSKGISLDSENGNPIGLWSDGTTLWVSDVIDSMLYAYTLENGARDAAKDVDMHADNAAPAAIWSDGTTMWVADWDDIYLYAYSMTGTRQGGL